MPVRLAASMPVWPVLVLLMTTAGCGKSDSGPPAAPPPPTVTVASPLVRDIVDWDEFTGYLEAPQSVELRARVGGQVTEVRFNEGSIVRRGELLVRIDPRPYKAALDAKVANVEQVKAQVALAKVTLDRYGTVVGTRAISQTDYDAAKAQFDQAYAQQQAAEAAVTAAKLDLEFCDVVAPIDGRLSYKYVTEGNLIAGGSDAGTLLTTIQSIDPMYCYVSVDERSVLKHKQLAAARWKAAGNTGPTTRPQLECYMGLIGERGTPHAGQIDFADNRVDPNTGTLRVRGVFRNPEYFLTPGMFARLRVPGSQPYRATLIPDAAIGTQQNIRYVYVLGPDDTVKLTPITPGTLFGLLRAVTGIGPNDRIVISGLVSIRDGTKVTPKDGAVPAGEFQTVGNLTPATAPTTSPATTPAAVRNPPAGGGR